MTHKTQMALAATLCLLMCSMVEAKPNLNKKELARIDKSHVFESSHKVKGVGVKMGKAIAVFEDVPEAVLYVMLQVDKYKHFIPRITDSRITKKKGWNTYVVVHTDLPWPVKDGWVYLQVKRRDKPGRVYEVTWRMLNGTMKEYKGSALIEPWSKDGKRTVVTYKLLAVPVTSAPDSMLTKGVRRIATIILKRMRLRLKALRKFKKLPKGM